MSKVELCRYKRASSYRDFPKTSLVVVVSGNESGEFQSHGEPTLAGERYRRAVENDVVEMWYYLQSQLNQLRHLLESSSPSLKNARNDVDGLAVHSMLTRVNDVIQTGVDYKRYMCIRPAVQHSMSVCLYSL